jgi:hypothetical protein
VDTCKETIQGFSKTDIGEGMVEALRKLKDLNDQLSKERGLKNRHVYLQHFKRLKLWSLFFNKIKTILNLGRLLTWHNKTLNLS